MDKPVMLRTDGSHSAEYTREVADTFAECVRVLNHATMGDAGLEYPADAEQVLAALCTGTQRLPQLFGQVGAFLQRQAASGMLGDDRGRDPYSQARLAGLHLDDAADAAGRLSGVLRAAQNAIFGLYVKGDADDV